MARAQLSKTQRPVAWTGADRIRQGADRARDLGPSLRFIAELICSTLTWQGCKMWPPRKFRFGTWLTRISTILQMIAIPAAAYCAFARFPAEDALALELRPKIRTELSWTHRSKEGC